MVEGGVRDGGGTSQALGSAMYMGRFNGRIDFGGKTGTSNNHSDAWFIGVTPALVGGAWVGGEYRSIHFRSGRLGQGSRTALPIFGLFMNKLLNDPLFAPRYLKLYGKAPQGVTPAMYGYTYVPREEPVFCCWKKMVSPLNRQRPVRKYLLNRLLKVENPVRE